VLALLLVLGALYTLAIARLSPHPLPGLSRMAGLLFCVGVTNAFIGTRFRRVEIGLTAAAVVLGLLAVSDVVIASLRR
jgi:hypothetical protein